VLFSGLSMPAATQYRACSEKSRGLIVTISRLR
jgi:hypothetical protein